MSGGQLVVLDRLGRAGKRYPLRAGLATIGADAACDIRLMLPDVSAHHATVVVHHNQTVVHSMSQRATLVNGAAVSVAALRHGDVLALGGRALRWEYDDPAAPRPLEPLKALARRALKARPARRHTEPPPRAPPAPPHRATTAASSGGKQVAIVQPQRRDHAETPGGTRARASRGPEPAAAAAAMPTTMATQWIESRQPGPRSVARATPQATPETTPATTPARAARTPARAARRAPRRAASARRSTPLRAAVLRAHRLRVTKIQGPLKMDSTKQAAIMLMTRHTPKSAAAPSAGAAAASAPAAGAAAPSAGASAPAAASYAVPRRPHRMSLRYWPNKCMHHHSYHDQQPSGGASGSNSSAMENSEAEGSAGRSPPLPSPRKSALKNPNSKTSRKSDSIKFDLSNLETSDRSDVTDMPLRYSDTSAPVSPRRSISRSGRMLQATGQTLAVSPRMAPAPAAPAQTPKFRKSYRGGLILLKTLTNSADASASTRRTAKGAYNRSWRFAAQLTRNPNASGSDDAYSIIDLVSGETTYTSDPSSLYDSAASAASAYDTPEARAESLGGAPALGSSTPYESRRRPSSPNGSTSPAENARAATASAPDAVTTPENSEDTAKNITFNSTRISRASKSRSRLNDSDVVLVDEDESPRSSRARPGPAARKNISVGESPSPEGAATPESRRSPVEVGTPVLNIQSLLDATRSRTGNRSRRKTVGVLRSGSGRGRPAARPRRSLGLRTRSVPADSDPSHGDDGTVTPVGADGPVPEGVKNKHSTAKKPRSKRSLIDDLHDSDIVKQLFSSPVKRKLSQSMTEFSRKRLFDDEEHARPHSATAGGKETPEDSLEGTDRTAAFTPDRFVSPLGSSSGATPDDEPRDARGGGRPLRTPRARRSIRNDPTDVAGVKSPYDRKSLRNSLGDVGVKEVFAASPNDDSRRVSGVRALFRSKRSSPRNELSDLRGVRNLFDDREAGDDLRNVSGVKRCLRRNSPRNEMSDLRGVKGLFRRDARDELSDVSGVEQLFQRSSDFDSTFDQLMGRPPIKAPYSKSRSYAAKSARKAKRLKTRSLRESMSLITNNVEEWLQNQLRDRLHADGVSDSDARKTPNKSRNKSMNLSRELNKLTTDTVEGASVLSGRTRNARSATEMYSAHMLPIKKRSLASLNRSAGKPGAVGRLPIKKRAVVHSTPVRGRDVTMNASEIGRMSPIAADVGGIRTPPQPHASPKDQPETSRRATKPPPSVTKSRTTRRRRTKHEIQELANVKKRQLSIVITKMPPLISPKASPEKALPQGAAPAPSPRRTRARGQRPRPQATPKNKARASLVVTKSTLKKNPRATRTAKLPAESYKQTNAKEPKTRRGNVRSAEETADRSGGTSIVQTRRGRRNAMESAQAVMPHDARNTRQVNAQSNALQVPEPEARPRRKRADPQTMKADNVSGKTKEPTRVTKQQSEELKESVTRSRKTNKVEVKEVRKGRKAPSEVAVENKSLKTISEDVEVKKSGRRTKKVDGETVEEKKSGRRTQKTEVKEPVTRKAKAESKEAKPAASRGQKTKAQDLLPIESKKARVGPSPGRAPTTRKGKTALPDSLQDEKGGKRARSADKPAGAGKRRARGAGDADVEGVTVEKEVDSRRTRRAQGGEGKPAGRNKGAAGGSPAPSTSGRKRRANAVASDAKESKKQPAKKARVAAPATRAAAPAARAAAPAASAPPPLEGSRGRRRK